MCPSGASTRMVPTPATMSPAISTRRSASHSTMCPDACPGVCSTSQRSSAASDPVRCCPSASVRSTTTVSRSSSAVRACAHTGTPRLARSHAAAPTWSMWWWVSTTPAKRRPAASSASSAPHSSARDSSHGVAGSTTQTSRRPTSDVFVAVAGGRVGVRSGSTVSPSSSCSHNAESI
jgi:hypothetical protein